jgi:predicted dehydrogenase
MAYKIGVVGCGAMGRSHLKTITEQLPEFEIAGLCDPFDGAREQVREDFGLEIKYEDCAQMCQAVELDLVVVATQTRGHHAPAIAALERGISVLCEKPIAIDLVEADEMVEAAKKSGAKFAINQQNHVNRGVRKGLDLVRSGLVGEVVMIRGRNKCGRKSGNEFMEMGTHVTDMMICFGGPAEWCSGTVYWEGRPAVVDDIMESKEMSPRDRDSGLVVGDRTVGQYGFPGGVLGEIHFLGYEKTYTANYGLDVLGTEGQLAFRGAVEVDHNLWHLPRPMEGLPTDFGDWQPIDVSDVSDASNIATMYRELMAARDNGGEPPGSGEEGRAAFEMILGLYQSHREGGGRLALPMSERRHPLEMWREEG